ncbi:predicted protein [Scheffersomyces stipitis CBS 6054]|uniref:Uncharacterized protein n=1 Tax=Scheffersomyces stipitis (strain ATCC 58785 / CBS 6054 / NBRC 10063 / NRRL Y-11545) TaxID=322104 RepID=A3M069_PICST|nr:predicted protein [Scheffersomyces stipitis CBS 6054]ABN68664.2 predicted protein [Scheffersomyces stipitis CBS 6054]
MDRSNFRKRKRVPSFQPEGSGLLLSDPPQAKQAENIITDEKVINYILKLQPKTTERKEVFLKLVLSYTEAEFLSSSELNLEDALSKKFQVKSFSISPQVDGVVDRFITLYGDNESIARGVVYISFLLKVKLNRFIRGELYTLKSNNYDIEMVIRREVYPHDNFLDSFNFNLYEDTFPLWYNQNRGVHLLHIRSDFLTLFLFTSALLLRYKDSEEDFIIVQTPLFGVHTDPNLFAISDTNKEMLEKSRNGVVSYLHPK